MNIRHLLLPCLAIVLNSVTVGTGHGLLLPLLPLATITGHAGLYSAGMTGAALLKLKAASTLGALFALAGNGFHFKLGHGWAPDLSDFGQHDHHGHHEHHGHHDHGHHGGWHRRRRSATEADGRGETTDNVENAQYDPTLDEVLSYDQLGCGMRLVCELAATPRDQLPDDGKLILELFGRDGKAPNPTKASRGKLSYSYASILGENAKDASACARVYARCPYNGEQIIQSLRDANV